MFCLRKLLDIRIFCTSRKFLHFCNYQNVQNNNKAKERVAMVTSLLNRNINNIWFSSAAESKQSIKFEKACEETLETLSEYFENLIDKSPHLAKADVSYSDGVLTINLGPEFGTYVINRQVPNRQIWLSSPISGPKRYDFIDDKDGYWLYKHDGKTLHQLLQEELKEVVKSKIDFSSCAHSKSQ